MGIKNYRFINVQVGDYGRASDGGVYSGLDIEIGMENQMLHVPAYCPLPGANQQGPLPCTMVGDYPPEDVLNEAILPHHQSMVQAVSKGTLCS